MPDIAMAYDALSKDARAWDGAGDDLATAHAAAQAIDVYRGAFSFGAMGVADEYFAKKELVLALLQKGAETQHAAAQTLRDIRTDFEDVEHEIIKDLDDLWQFKY